MPQASYRRGSALIIRRFLKYIVEPIRVVSAICARWTNIKAMTQSLLQQNGQTNRSVLKPHAVCIQHFHDSSSVVHERVQKNAFIEHVHFYENDELNAT